MEDIDLLALASSCVADEREADASGKERKSERVKEWKSERVKEWKSERVKEWERDRVNEWNEGYLRKKKGNFLHIKITKHVCSFSVDSGVLVWLQVKLMVGIFKRLNCFIASILWRMIIDGLNEPSFGFFGMHSKRYWWNTDKDCHKFVDYSMKDIWFNI